MRISFGGFDNPVELAERGVTIFRVERECLFSRVCESLLSLKGYEAVEPYSVWDDDGREIAPRKAFLIVPNVFDLPWGHKDLLGGLYARLEEDLLLDEGLRSELQNCGEAMKGLLNRLGIQMNAEYRFGLEWNLKGYLKAFSYEVDLSNSSSILDKLISFVDLGADMQIDKVLVFVNLTTFLSEIDLTHLHQRAFFHGIRILLIENQRSVVYMDHAVVYIVDRDFIEFVYRDQSASLSSLQGRICSNGFGAVAY